MNGEILPLVAPVLAEITIDVPAWASVLVVILGTIGTIGSVFAVFSTAKMKVQLQMLKDGNEALRGLVADQKSEADEKERYYGGVVAELKAKVEVLQSEMIRSLVISIREAVVAAIRQAYQETRTEDHAIAVLTDTAREVADAARIDADVARVEADVARG